MGLSAEHPVVVENSLIRYRSQVQSALARLGDADAGAGPAPGFCPGHLLPDPDERLVEFFSPSGLAFHDLGRYQGKRLTLLDLMRNPRTRTTKTYPSLVIVARAVRHIMATGERVVIVTPSSANKATALRDAVWRASSSGLVAPGMLRICAVVPESSRAKLWASPLSEDPWLAARNPVFTYAGAHPDEVKALARGFVDGWAETFKKRHGVNLWHTLDIENYKVADVIRAHAEYEFLPRESADDRLHVHAVSSAFGLLGHNLGLRQLADGGVNAPKSRYFLVQHLDTPDMVLSLYHGSPDRDHAPAYTYDAADGLHRQHEDPRFPQATADPRERLDPTFYTRRPATSAEMNEIIRTRGGGGIVVSGHECRTLYPRIRRLLAPAGIVLPEDPGLLREWSLVMALTGVLQAVDRGLVAEDDILVHGSGSYHAGDFRPLSEDRLTPVTEVEDLAEKAAWAVEDDADRAASR
ncbi:DUF6002 family protein [Streptomyces sparsogenes]|uniref:DUF6002 family protein n=1 Tax=Streptomyces sparsogenes TaxID=67365 RepID=UPI003850AC45